jgi:hypothetical protein
VSRIVTSRVVTRREAEIARVPRTGLILEREIAPGRFEAEAGPVSAYERRLDTEDAGPDQVRLTEEVEYRLAIPFFGRLFALPFRRAMRRGDARIPWWAPPDRVDALGGCGRIELAPGERDGV